MEFSYTCRNQNCCFPGKNNFKMTIDQETVMDERNIATVFCPFCKNEMEPDLINDQTVSIPNDLSRSAN